ncbi:hypothetical protein J2T13_000856 [Paenibacillus sp. DS2015]|uniref:hypothetical protein n=1 Tax=Paenibacillus sp. DS2015 TaxID=3373917 RepID=UPI003D1B8A31
MKLYLVIREHFGYDEFESVIVRAEDEKRAFEIAIELSDDFKDEHTTVKEVQVDGEEGVIHGNFNAG